MKTKTLAILKSPITVLFSIFLGVLFGVFAKKAAIYAAPIGDMYLFFIQMCVLPILLTAIVSSLSRIIRHKAAQKYLLSMVFSFLIAMLVMSVCGVVFGLIGQPGKNLDNETLSVLGKIINTTRGSSGILVMSLNDSTTDVVSQSPSVLTFLKQVVPNNIFNALGDGRALEVVFFSIIFGLVLGVIRDQNAKFIVYLSKSALIAFQKLISWSMYGLPIALIFLIGAQVAQVGVEMFYAMARLVAVFYIGGFLIFIGATIVLWIKSGMANPFKVLKVLLDPIIISFATRNSFAALPAAINAMRDKLLFERTITNLVMSLGVTVCRYGNIFYFAMASVFVAQLYSAPLGGVELFIIVIGSIFAGTATAGASGLLTLPMISLVLSPLGLPVEAILVLFMAIDSIIDPMRTFLIVYVNMAATSVITPKIKIEKRTGIVSSPEVAI